MKVMNFIRILSIIVYVYTALLPVHAFAMHGSTHDMSDTQHQVVDQGCCDAHAHHGPQANEKHTKHGDMKTCLKQSEGVLIGNDGWFGIIEKSSVLSFVGFEWSGIDQNHAYEETHYDPGREEYSSFQRFVRSHYGQIIMQC